MRIARLIMNVISKKWPQFCFVYRFCLFLAHFGRIPFLGLLKHRCLLGGFLGRFWMKYFSSTSLFFRFRPFGSLYQPFFYQFPLKFLAKPHLLAKVAYFGNFPCFKISGTAIFGSFTKENLSLWENPGARLFFLRRFPLSLLVDKTTYSLP